jgi:hypothetical protein
MAQDLTQLTIFFSGTSETDAESAALKTVVEELNRRLIDFNRISLKVITWPDDFRPGVNLDTQSEINRQIQGRYDIYIGVLGSKFGTPTLRASSGTEEEFQLAISQFLKEPTSIRVFFYFKTTGQDPFSINIEQLKKVQQFRSELPHKGVLYRDFKDTIEFVEMVKNHIWQLIIDEWNGKAWKPIESPSPESEMKIIKETKELGLGQQPKENEIQATIVKEDFNISPEEEVGFFDLMEEFYASVTSLTSIMIEMAEYTKQIGEQLNKHTESANRLMEKYGNKVIVGGSRESQKYLSEAKAVVNSAASDLDSYTKRVSPNIAALKTDLGVILSRFRDVYIFTDGEFKRTEEQKKEDAEAFREFTETMKTVVGQITAFQVSITNLPALTGQLNKARKHTAAILGALIAEIKIAIDQADDILGNINPQE